MSTLNGLEVRWVESVLDIDEVAWNYLAQPLPTPFFEYEWLSLLEGSGSVVPQTGWQPRYLLCFRRNKLVAACPLYRKTHSEGEFVFDYMWVEAAGTLGLPYFPKLVGMSPVTPVSAYQFLIDPAEDPAAVTGFLCRTILDFSVDQGLSGVHFQYVDAAWVKASERDRLAIHYHQSYQVRHFRWRRPDFPSGSTPVTSGPIRDMPRSAIFWRLSPKIPAAISAVKKRK